MAARHTFQALNQTFVVDAGYDFVRPLGTGAYGCVVAARHRQTGEGCAIKKITSINSKRILAKRCLREIKLLHHFRGHPNITNLYDMDIVLNSVGDFDDVYLYQDLMEADLHAIIRSGQPLTDSHYQFFLYQVLCGVKYIHSANVIHRDLKPGNLVVNSQCQLKICDFGLARGYSPNPNPPSQTGSTSTGGQGLMTEYVATRWYRAPEIMLSVANYGPAVDLWSVGCIFAEIVGGKPLFKGKDYVDQLSQILHYVGTPNALTLHRVASPRAQDYIRSLPIKSRIPLAAVYPHATASALDLMTRLLTFDPYDRISATDALDHPYLATWRKSTDEPVCSQTFDFGFEAEDEMDGMKRLIVDEVNTFRVLVRSEAYTPSPSVEPSTLPEELTSVESRSTAPSSFDVEEPVLEDPSDEFERELKDVKVPGS